MGSIYSFLKRQALTLFPESVLRVLRGWHYRRALEAFTDSDEPDVTVVRELVQRGTTVIDLGANIGIYTKVLAELVGPSGKVISVEPVPQTFDILTRNVEALKLSNVTCLNVAVSDREGEVIMELPDYATGGINFYQAAVVGSAGKAVSDSKRHLRASSVTLDALAANRGPIDFVKCDVEGHELACLSGAQAVLDTHAPAWLIEVWGDPDDSGTNAMKLFKVFESLSYVAWWFDGHRLVRRRAGDRSTNYFFLADSHVARLEQNAPHFFMEARD